MRPPRFLPISFFAVAALAADPASRPAERVLADYFATEVTTLESQPFPSPSTEAEWEKERSQLRGELAEMLGLNPLPERTPLGAVKTGETEGEGFVVEKLYLQSQPGLYVTANLYRPAQTNGKAPAILYVCGHSEVKGKDGKSLGNKVAYQHHGAWFARHGYVCLVMDTLP